MKRPREKPKRPREHDLRGDSEGRGEGGGEQKAEGKTLLNHYRAKLLSLARSHAALLAQVEEAQNSSPVDLQSYSQLSDSDPPPPSPPKRQLSLPKNPLFAEGAATYETEINNWLSKYDAASRLSLQSNFSVEEPASKKGRTEGEETTTTTTTTATSLTLPERPNVRVGVGVLIKREGGVKVFAGIRKGSHGAGTLALPGGHLEFGEGWEETAIREVEEECGILLEPGLKLVHVTNDPMPDENKHYVTLFMGATCGRDAELMNAEPHKCEGWEELGLEEVRRREGWRFSW
ncbi:hypothetical protein TL16_g05348 [Triparma laevis f. inornata]|uniref:Nudix hydrolase domain-containing protein n=1 Tax=Triparma laevis f. inornata TaxID=1714386 RepID=A0A9W7ADA3_9STRA|nr:hypothetical protein TL16_g05348 [Triparma laevis f. inornata]